MVYAMELLDEPMDVFMWDGGLPQQPRPPFQYLLTFNMAGLTNEYAEPAIFLRDGKITEVEPISELETVQFPQPISGRKSVGLSGSSRSIGFILPKACGPRCSRPV
jgi:lysine 6-dehydrogenase